MEELKNLFKQTNDDLDDYLIITPTTVFMWFVGLFLIVFAAVNEFF
ncbi:MAG TPA: hypothetical protein PLT82_05595 [Candidatus Hydrogenedens sp.]|nr:hypothetical protein [Candidatus Hydrogenedens sp.]HOK09343.1 hypothetical protein [Candidatus Hydrogenedens sp.]HOL21157.1 hypothetical protein [Candidatus Hydrogenedens sp.]HPP58587.1 hypothetical protein [Candidatus Hydrogenedens sp.]